MIMTVQVNAIDASVTIKPAEQQRVSVGTMNEFLRQVQKPAYRMAKLSTQNTEDALDLVQDAMMKLVQNYQDKPVNELKPLFYRILTSSQ